MNSKLFIVGVFFLILNSCQVIRFKNNSKDIFLENKKQSTVDFSSKKIFAKGKINFNIRNQKQSLNISIKTNKDSIIMFSALAPLGIEVFRGQITNDSLYFVDRVNKNYQIVSMDSLNIIDKSKYKVKEIINLLFLTDESLVQQKERPTNLKPNQTEKENTIFRNILGQQQAKIIYSNYKFVEKINIPFNLNVNTENEEININFTQISFLEKLKITKFKIPKGYEK